MKNKPKKENLNTDNIWRHSDGAVILELPNGRFECSCGRTVWENDSSYCWHVRGIIETIYLDCPMPRFFSNYRLVNSRDQPRMRELLRRLKAKTQVPTVGRSSWMGSGGLIRKDLPNSPSRGGTIIKALPTLAQVFGGKGVEYTFLDYLADDEKASSKPAASKATNLLPLTTKRKIII